MSRFFSQHGSPFFILVALLALCAHEESARAQSNYPNSLSALTSDSLTQCGMLYASGYGHLTNGDFEKGYDTLRLYLEHCYWERDAWRAFGDVGAAVSQWSQGGKGRWPDYLTWLKRVLYLNQDSMWYCADVGEMLTAMQSDQVMKLSELRYILDNHLCQGFADWAKLYNTSSYWRHKMWVDSITNHYDSLYGYGNWADSLRRDTLAHPYDSTIPSLEQENLQLLRGPQNAVSESQPISASQALLSARLLSDPVRNDIGFSFEMDRPALITAELRDVLGRSVPVTYAKYQFAEAGTHTAHIPAPNLPSGTYYLRISTDKGEVITLKFVME